VTTLRIFFVGGLTSYRALFGFLEPAVYIPGMLIAPVFQVLLFVYIGRSAGVGDDEFFVIGNAIQYASIPCVFAMTQLIGGERFQQTLGFILVTPAARLPLFLGRALPVMLNAWFISAFTFAVSAALLDLDVPASSLPAIALVGLLAAFSCTGLGLVTGGIALIVREAAVLSNIVFGLLLVFTGANVPRDRLPGWMEAVGEGLPFTHAIEAARRLADGASLRAVGDLIGAELLVGTAYLVVGYALLRALERASRRFATLERA
jgi:ABC-2 type transport system permease protein